jgi:hypothetical protein
MARDKINSGATDVTEGASSVLVSLVQGEQLELPVILDIFPIATNAYTFLCKTIEADNDGTGNIPTAMKASPVKLQLQVRIPNNGVAPTDYVANTSYPKEAVVKYANLYYRQATNNNYTIPVGYNPSTDPNWIEHDPKTVYIQFPSGLSTGYLPQPSVVAPVYCFMELEVTDVNTSIYIRTWKPVRGMVQILFSPTEIP